MTFFEKFLFENKALGLVVFHGAAVTFQPTQLTVGNVLDPFLMVAAGLMYI